MNINISSPIAIDPTRSKYEEVKKILESLTEDCNTSISGDYLEEILKQIEIHGVPSSYEKIFRKHKWFFYHGSLESLESCYRNSKEFDRKRAVSLFHKHIECLKTQGYDVNKPLMDRSSLSTPLYTSLVNKSSALVSAIIDSGADIDYSCFFSFTKSQPFVDEMDEIVTTIADRERTDYFLCTLTSPLRSAAHYGNDRAVRSLVKAKADINRSHGIITPVYPLQSAIRANSESSNLDTVKAIVELGADLFILNEEGLTVASLARRARREDIANYLDEKMVSYIKERENILLVFIPVNVLTSIILDYITGDTKKKQSAVDGSSKDSSLVGRISVIS